MTNSTVSGNSAVDAGGGIFSQSGVTVTHSTITRNSAATGAGIHAFVYCYNDLGCSAAVELAGSIVADNRGDNCLFVVPETAPQEAIVDRGNNFTDDATCPPGFATITGLDTVLADNGGPTVTHALLAGSPAIDAAGDQCLATDQRGVARPQDGDGDGVASCDAGAFELQRQMIAVDVMPDGVPNTVNPYSRGVIPVAILGSETFDAADVDVTTLAFGPSGAPPAHNLSDTFTYNDHLQDVNLDGYSDLVVHFRTQDTDIACGDDSATLTGETLDGQPFEGTDSINTVGCLERSRPAPAIWYDKERAVRSGDGSLRDPTRK